MPGDWNVLALGDVRDDSDERFVATRTGGGARSLGRAGGRRLGSGAELGIRNKSANQRDERGDQDYTRFLRGLRLQSAARASNFSQVFISTGMRIIVWLTAPQSLFIKLNSLLFCSSVNHRTKTAVPNR